MKKADIKKGEQYYIAQGRSYVYGERRVLVVDEELHTGRNMNSVPRSALVQDPAYVKAHLANALAEAYADETTPKEAKAAEMALREALDTARRAWFEADPLRAFAPGKYGSSWNPAGVLVQYLDAKTGEAKGYGTEPRNRFRSTWAEHVKAVAETKAYQERKANAEAIRKAELEVVKTRLVLTLKGLGFEDGAYDSLAIETDGKSISFGCDIQPGRGYGRDKVTLTHEALLTLLELAINAGSEYAATEEVTD